MNLLPLLTNPYTLLVILIIGVLLVVLSNKLNISFRGFNFNIHKNNSYKAKINAIFNASNDYTQKYSKYKNNILRNQLSFAEGVINDIIVHRPLKELVLLNIRSAIKENGFEKFDTLCYSQYVGRKIDDVAILLREHGEGMTNVHRDKIAEIFNHALITYNYWNDKIKELDKEFEERIARIIK